VRVPLGLRVIVVGFQFGDLDADDLVLCQYLSARVKLVEGQAARNQVVGGDRSGVAMCTYTG
jgi:hypothetical protein